MSPAATDPSSFNVMKKWSDVMKKWSDMIKTSYICVDTREDGWAGLGWNACLM